VGFPAYPSLQRMTADPEVVRFILWAGVGVGYAYFVTAFSMAPPALAKSSGSMTG
jgi:hypothetical protein